MARHFVLFVLHFLWIQQRILSSVPLACPEIPEDSQFRAEMAPKFEALINEIWQSFASKRPEQVSRWTATPTR